MNRLDYIQDKLTAKILYEYGIASVEVNNLSGGREKKCNLFKTTSLDCNGSVLSKLESMNILMNNSYLKVLLDELSNLNERAKSNNLYFSCSIEYETQHIQINKNRCVKDDYRVISTGRLVLTDQNKVIFYKDIKIHKNILEMIDECQVAFSHIEKEALVSKKSKKIRGTLRKDIIFSQEAAGYFIHEVFGHSLEGDLIVNKMSVFSEMKIGDKLSDIRELNIIDDPYIIPDIGLNRFDDEGEVLKKITLIEDGKLSGFLCDNDISKIISNSNKYSSCARSSSYKLEPICRMRTTYLDSNNSGLNLHEIINSVNDVYLVKNIYSGEVNPITGEYSLTCGLCSYIKNGNIVEDIYGITIRGHILETLNSIEIIGNDLSFNTSNCIKLGQVLKVGMGSPSILINNLCVGE